MILFKSIFGWACLYSPKGIAKKASYYLATYIHIIIKITIANFVLVFRLRYFSSQKVTPIRFLQIWNEGNPGNGKGKCVMIKKLPKHPTDNTWSSRWWKDDCSKKKFSIFTFRNFTISQNEDISKEL